MTDRIPLLSAAFSTELDEPTRETVARLRRHARFAAGALGLGRETPGHYLDAAGVNVLRTLQNALTRPIDDILADAWKRYEPFRKYCDKQRYPAGSVSQERLLEHTVEIAARPSVAVLLADIKVADLEFDVSVALRIDGGTLTIQDAKIMSMRPGDCSVSGKIELEGITLVERKSSKLEVPGEIRFGNGIPIKRTADEEVLVAAQSS
jgi:hypothetical protein